MRTARRHLAEPNAKSAVDGFLEGNPEFACPPLQEPSQVIVERQVVRIEASLMRRCLMSRHQQWIISGTLAQAP